MSFIITALCVVGGLVVLNLAYAGITGMLFTHKLVKELDRWWNEGYLDDTEYNALFMFIGSREFFKMERVLEDTDGTVLSKAHPAFVISVCMVNQLGYLPPSGALDGVLSDLEKEWEDRNE